MIWSKRVAGSAFRAIAAAAVTRSARPRISATMISLPAPFILANSTKLFWGALMRGYMAEKPPDYQSDGPKSDQSAARPGKQKQHDRKTGNQQCREEHRTLAGDVGDTGEAEPAGNQRDNQQYDDPFQHGRPLF